MSRDKAETIAYAIRKECQRSSLYDWCESWDITTDEFEEFLENGIKGSEVKWLKTKSQNIARKSVWEVQGFGEDSNIRYLAEVCVDW